jgi:two-component system cell cycle response regulator
MKMAVTDQLTGLHNRRYLSHHLDRQLAATQTSGVPFSVIIMDIDRFKHINDTFGHDVGDEVLKEFARRILPNVRTSDLTCRYGGEEFVVVMPQTAVSQAYAIAERLRMVFETTPIEISRKPDKLSITVSMGIAGSKALVETAEALLYRADQALYGAKRAGRNRVFCDAA